MALRWMDGFEQYGTDETIMVAGVGGGAAWSNVSSGWALSTANPATQTAHMRMTDASNGHRELRRIFGTASQVVGFGYRFSVEELPDFEGAAGVEGALVLADFRDVANANQVMIVMGTDGSVVAYRGADINGFPYQSGTYLDRSEPCIAAGGYHHIEFKLKVANSGGYIEVRVNEVTVLNLTGIDTQDTANASAAQVAIGKSGTGASTAAGFSTFDLDDTYAWDDDSSDAENTVVDWIGDKGCYFRKPNADTATSDFAKSTGATNYGLIDEVPPSGGTDYLTDSTGTARTIVEVEDLPGNISEVIAWMPVIYAEKEDSGSVTLRGGVVVGTDESYGPDDSPATAFAYLRPGPKTIDPSTGVAWDNTTTPNLLIERTV